MKRVMSTISILAIILGMLIVPSIPSNAGTDITITVDGQYIEFDEAKPYINADSRLMVPLSFISNAFNAEVSWDADSKKVTIVKGTDTLTLKIGSKIVTTNKKQFEMDTRAIIHRNRTYVPVRFIMQFYGADVQWGPVTKTAAILSKEYVGDLQSNVSDTKDKEDNTLTWYYVGSGPQKEVAAIEKKVNEYIKDKINAKVKLVCYDWGTYDQKMAVKIASQEEFDICFTASWTNNYYRNIAKGAFVDITQMMDQYAPKTKAILGKNVITGASVNGKLYTIPAMREKAHNWILCFNKKLVEKYNFDISSIKTLEDLKPMLEVIKEKEPGVYGLEALQGESLYRVLDFEKMVDDDCPGAIYGDYRDTKVINDFDTPEAKSFYDLIRKYYKAGYIRKDAGTVQDYAADEKAGKIFAHVKWGRPGTAEELSLTQGVEWVQVDLTAPVMKTIDVTESMQAISSSSKNPELALEFLELFNTDKYLNNLINFGIEGKHYVKISNNIIDFPEWSDGGRKLGYNPGTPWMFGNQFINYLFTLENPQKWEYIKAFNDSATPSPLLGFVFDAYPIRSEIAALENVKRQYFPSLETGMAGDTSGTLAKMNRKFKDAGLGEVLSEMQRQVDAFIIASDN